MVAGTLSSGTHRADIQALRGIAVLLVLLYHTGLAFDGAGFLGVDVFFVISGFLITGIVSRGIVGGTFGFREFYWRRARRILPALWMVIGVSAILSGLFLTVEVRENFNETAIGSLLFVSNIVLWQQADYFGTAAAFQPLLHVWSLAIEEQFYLFIPLLLVLFPRRHHLTLLLVLTTSSALLCWVSVAYKPQATFYLLPTRAWELGVGGALAVWVLGKGDSLVPLPSWAGIAAVAVLPLVATFPPGKTLGYPHPSFDASLVVVATAIILISRCPPLEQGVLARGLGWFGNISYSLYLVHWPIVAFCNNAYLGSALPLTTRVMIAVASVGLAVVLHRGVEKPMRFGGSVYGHAFGWGGVVSLLLLGGMVAWTDKDTAASVRLGPNHGLSATCDQIETFQPLTECMTGAAPEVVVWGDSYAMHLIPALEAPDTALLQATKSTCGPVFEVVPRFAGFWRGYEWMKDCLNFNADVMHWLQDDQEVKIVVLSSMLGQYFFFPVEDTTGRKVDITPERLANAIVVTATRIRKTGKRVVFVAPPPGEGHAFHPRPGFDIGLCLERRSLGLVVLGAKHDCAIDEAAWRAREVKMLDTVNLIESSGVPVLRFEPLLCDGSMCRTQMGQTGLYQDQGHFSIEGARALGRSFGLLERLKELAS